MRRNSYVDLSLISFNRCLNVGFNGCMRRAQGRNEGPLNL